MANIFTLGSSRNTNQEPEEENQTNWIWYKNINQSSTQTWQNTPQEQEIFMNHHQRNQMNVYDLSTSSSRSSTICCRDCGNQAKKGCTHMRCRTCCKSHGLDCPTHVRSTWIPIAKRRERKQQIQPETTAHGDGAGQINSPKRYRPAANLDSSEMEDTKFPEEVNSNAMFRCVRMSGTEDERDGQYAYQTTVDIAGHLFKGILYDQGPISNYNKSGNTGNSRGSSAKGRDRGGPENSVAAAVVEPNAGGYYPSDISMFMPQGTQYYQNARP